MTFGSLFSGIGGIDLGLERVGMEVRWQIEIDEFCRRILAKHWSSVKRFGDVRELTGNELEPVDLVCGGFPCQPVSQAGRRRGQDDPRWLWPEFARIIRVVRPRYVLVENVPGLLALGMGQVPGDLAESGYDAEWDCIPAAAFGAPHLRYRVFIVAYPSSIRRIQDQIGAFIFNKSIQEKEGQSAWRGHLVRNACGGIRFLPDWRIHGMAYGVSHWMDRIRALGNAVVPQVVEWIGRRILEFEKQIGDAANDKRSGNGY